MKPTTDKICKKKSGTSNIELVDVQLELQNWALNVQGKTKQNNTSSFCRKNKQILSLHNEEIDPWVYIVVCYAK